MAAAAGSGGETGSAGVADEAALLAKLTRTYGATIASASASSLDVGVTGGAAGVDASGEGAIRDAWGSLLPAELQASVPQHETASMHATSMHTTSIHASSTPVPALLPPQSHPNTPRGRFDNTLDRFETFRAARLRVSGSTLAHAAPLGARLAGASDANAERLGPAQWRPVPSDATGVGQLDGLELDDDGWPRSPPRRPWSPAARGRYEHVWPDKYNSWREPHFQNASLWPLSARRLAEQRPNGSRRPS